MSNVVPLKPPKFTKLQCPSCGAKVEAGCDCGVAYAPAAEIAKAAILLNPALSNREIARNLGLSNQTVMRARQSVAPKGATDAHHRTGKDGKSYVATKPRKLAPVSQDDDPEPEPDDFRRQFLNCCVGARELAYYTGPFPAGWGKTFAKQARITAQHWLDLADSLEQERTHEAEIYD